MAKENKSKKRPVGQLFGRILENLWRLYDLFEMVFQGLVLVLDLFQSPNKIISDCVSIPFGFGVHRLQLAIVCAFANMLQNFLLLSF